MADELYLEIISGPQKNTNIAIFEGLLIGRNQGDLIIEDPRVSGLHAEVYFHQKRQTFVMRDRDSHHKIKFKNQKVDKLALIPGIEFQLGDTTIRVITVNQLESQKPLKAWQVDTIKLIDETLNSLNEQPLLEHFFALEQPLLIEILEGIDSGTHWALGYAPRKVGRSCFDIDINEPNAPPTAFEITNSTNKGLQLITKYPAIVRFNDQAQYQFDLETECLVTIGQSKIRIGFN